MQIYQHQGLNYEGQLCVTNTIRDKADKLLYKISATETTGGTYLFHDKNGELTDTARTEKEMFQKLSTMTQEKQEELSNKPILEELAEAA